MSFDSINNGLGNYCISSWLRCYHECEAFEVAFKALPSSQTLKLCTDEAQKAETILYCLQFDICN